MIEGTLIELTNDCVDFWATDSSDASFAEDHVGLLREGDIVVFLGVAPPDPRFEGQEDACDLLHVVSRFGVGFINASEVPEYCVSDKIKP